MAVITRWFTTHMVPMHKQWAGCTALLLFISIQMTMDCHINNNTSYSADQLKLLNTATVQHARLPTDVYTNICRLGINRKPPTRKGKRAGKKSTTILVSGNYDNDTPVDQPPHRLRHNDC